MPRRKPTTKKGKRAKMKTVMDEFKSGKLRSGSKTGPKVTNPKQAIAIGLSQSGQSRPGKKSMRSSEKSARKKKLENVKF